MLFLTLTLPFRLFDGAAVTAVAIAMFVNARGYATLRRSERRARRQAEKYLESAGTAIVVFDRDGIVQIANHTLCALLGRPVEEVVGADWISLAVPEDGRTRSRETLAAVMTGTREVVPHYEHELVTADGPVRLIQWTDVLVRDDAGRISGLLKSGLDMTAQRAVEQEVHQAAEDLGIVSEIAHAVATKDDARADLVRGVMRLTGGSIATLVEPTTDRRSLWVTATTNPVVEGTLIELDGKEPSGAATAFRTGTPFFVNDYATNAEVSTRLQDVVSLSSAMFQPVVVDGTVAGVLVVGWSTALESLDERARHLVEVGAHEAAIALRRAAGTDRLRLAAFSDPLTGIANRRAFDVELSASLGRAQQGGHPLCVAVLDLNKFKQLNDCEGHEAGDELLKDCARRWQDELRPSDLLARLGGDEFAVILPRCGRDQGHVIGDRLRHALAHDPGCGVGIALWDGHEDAASLLRRADQELYADKARSSSTRLGDAARLAALARTGLGSSSHDDVLDEISRTVAWLLDVPIALVSLLGADCHITASETGLGFTTSRQRESRVSDSFCQHTVTTRRPLIVPDARLNALVAGTPAVRDMGLLAYAGVPLIDEQGQALGALCALDMRVRDWSELDIAVLTRLAGVAAARLVELQHAAPRALHRAA